MDRSISIEKSKIIKVIAVLMMIWLHLYGHPDRIKNVEYVSLGLMKNETIEYLLASYMGICVRIFLFISGYGLYIKYKDNFRWENAKSGLKKIYFNYIVIFLAFVPIGYLIGKYKFNLKELILNLLTISNSYNGEWWFLNLYILLIISYVIGNKYIKKYSFKVVFITTVAVNFIGMVITKCTLVLGINNQVITNISNLLSTQIFFYTGVLVAKYGIFDSIQNKLKLSRIISVISVIALTGILIFRIDIPVIDSYIYMIVELMYIYFLIHTISIDSNLIKLSKHTTNIWLIHSFFCYHFFQELAFKPKYSILIFIWVLILSLISSSFINYLLEISKKKKPSFKGYSLALRSNKD